MVLSYLSRVSSSTCAVSALALASATIVLACLMSFCNFPTFDLDGEIIWSMKFAQWQRVNFQPIYQYTYNNKDSVEVLSNFI